MKREVHIPAWTHLLEFFSFFCTFASQLEARRNSCAGAITPPKHQKPGSSCIWCFCCSFGSRWNVWLRQGLRNVDSKRTSQVKEDKSVSVFVCMCACACMYVWQHVRLFASLPYVCTESMATRHCGLLVFDSKSSFLSFYLFLSFFLSFFLMTTRVQQLRLQVVFLTWSFLSRIAINIYFYISV